MSRSRHVTNRQLQTERRENAQLDLDATHLTELERDKLKKTAAKISTSWSRQSKKAKTKTTSRIRIKNGNPEIV